MPPTSSDRPTTLRVWLADYPFVTSAGAPFLDPARATVAEFEQAHPEFRVELTTHPFWTMADEVAKAAAADDPPHLAGYYAADAGRAHSTVDASGRPLFVPVEQAIAGRASVLGEPDTTGDLLPAAVGYYTFRGGLQALPFSVTAPALFANTTLLASVGITELPRTWAELALACSVLDGRVEHGVTWANHGWLTQEAVAVQGGLLATPDNGRRGRAERIHLTSPELEDWLRWWRELHRAGHYLYAGAPDDWEAAFTAFAEGRVAFTIDSAQAADAFAAIGARAGFDVALAPMPHNQARPRAAAFVSGDAFWLTAAAPPEVRDGALALALRLTGVDSVAGWHREHGFIPATESAVAALTGSGWFDGQPHRAALTDLARVDTSDPAALGPVFGVADAVNELLASAAHDVLTTDVDPASALGHAADRAAGLGTDLDRPKESR